MENLPVEFQNDKLESIKLEGSLTLARYFRSETMKLNTPSEYIQYKDKFPYLPSSYVDDLFNKIYPVHSIKVIGEPVVDSYYVVYTVEITVILPDGTKVTKNGVGGSRLQVSKDAKQRVLSGQGSITPFDYVDKGNNFKAAYTLAIKNCQERFGIGADVTGRIILSPEQMKEVEGLITHIIKDYIINPRDRSIWNEKRDNLKSTKDKIEFLQNLREQFPECEELFTNE